LMNVIARPDPDHRDFMALPPDATDYVTRLDAFEVKGKRIAVLIDSVYPAGVDFEVRQAVEDCARALEHAGAIVVPIPPWATVEALDAVAAFFEVRSHTEIMAMHQSERERILPFIIEWASHRAGGFSGSDLMRHLNAIHALRETTVQVTHRFDFVLSPVCPIPAFEADFCCPGNDPRHALEHIVFTVPYNLSEQPAASINWNYTRNPKQPDLPIGVQIAGRRFDDLGVLQLARVIEQLRPTQRPWPMLHVG
ncbi:MAG: amidase family protein, partial [Casimicrobiaceae bacterium]